MTLIQKTDNDMAAWTAPMEAERDELTAQVFITYYDYHIHTLI